MSGNTQGTVLPTAVQKQKDELDKRIADEFGAPGEGEQASQQPDPDTVIAPSTDTDYKHKYDVLQGKYNAEVPALHERLRLLEQQAKLKAIGQESPAPEPEAPEGPPEYLREDDADNFGEDMVEFNRRIAEGVAKEQMKPFIEQQKSIQRRAFESTLATLVPDWRDINANTDFLQWLGEEIPQTGMIRQQFLSLAERDLDATKVAEFFSTFKHDQATRNAAQPPAPDHISIPGSSQQTIPVAQVEGQVIPDQARVTPDPGSGKRTFTNQEVTDFYSRLARTPAHRRTDRMMNLKTEIDQAYSEGRIR
jgi:hypothetical protein